MELIEKIYKEWRWLTYYELNELHLELMLNAKFNNILNEKNIDFNKYTTDIIERFKQKDFEVSKEQIALYEKNIKIKINELYAKDPNCKLNFAGCFLRPIFIENCFIIVKHYKRADLIEKIKRNLIYYHWWDEFSFEELGKCIIDLHLTKSTTKLIDRQSLFDYFQSRFNTKDEFIDCLLSNFFPKEKMIKEMNSTFRGSVIFDYGWLFRNELTKSIRVFENECRFEFNEKIIGSFYNENLLFREIVKKFGNDYKIISQGSPEWLRPQRFDIYFPDINIAVEYQGEQHEYPVDFGGQGEKIARQQFEENLKRDNLKSDKAKDNNCNILYIFPNYNMENVIIDLNKIINEKIKDIL